MRLNQRPFCPFSMRQWPYLEGFSLWVFVASEVALVVQESPVQSSIQDLERQISLH